MSTNNVNSSTGMVWNYGTANQNTGLVWNHGTTNPNTGLVWNHGTTNPNTGLVWNHGTSNQNTDASNPQTLQIGNSSPHSQGIKVTSTNRTPIDSHLSQYMNEISKNCSEVNPIMARYQRQEITLEEARFQIQQLGQKNQTTSNTTRATIENKYKV